MKALFYRGVMVSKNSALFAALDKGDKKEAEKVFAETTKRYEALYSAEDRAWFKEKSSTSRPPN